MDENPDKKIDLRIIVSNLKIAEDITKSIINFDFEKKYNIIISSIIPTYNVEIVKNATNNADIILIGTYGYDDEYNLLYNELANDFNHIEILDFSNIDFNDRFQIEDEIKNSIIKVGLSFSINNIKIESIKKKFDDLTIENNNNLIENKQLLEENNTLKNDNKLLNDEITNLHSALDDIKSEFSNFKSRFNDIRSKDILEIYNLDDLLNESFNDDIIDEEKVIIATNKFIPEDIIVGQGFIGAKSREIAIDWLKIVKTALVFLENSSEELSEELNISKNGSSKDESVNDETTNVIDNDDSYEIPNNFENFWK